MDYGKHGTAIVGALATMFAAPGQAQEEAKNPEAAFEVQTEVVVAQKREEKLQEVPLSVAVVNAEALSKAAAYNAESLLELVPSVTFRKGTTNVNSSLNIRGVGTISFSAGVEPSVSTVLDGVVLARSGMAFTDFLDLERVEVLRGPQGTLFGKNSSAGVVQLITKDPTPTFTASAQATTTDDNEYRGMGVISGPISETLKGRLTGFYGTYDGNVDNVFNGTTVNGYERYGTRGKLQWDPSTNVSVKFTGDYSKANDECCADIIGFVDPTVASNTRVLLPSLSPVVPNDANMQIDNDLQPRTKDENYGASTQVDVSLGSNTFTSITAYRKWQNTEIRDGDFRSDAPAFVTTSVPGGDTRSQDFGTLDFDEFTQELRITSPDDVFVEYVGGLYYYNTQQDNFFQRSILQCTASSLAPLANGNVPCNQSSTFAANSGVANFTTKMENYAAFGNFTINVVDDFRVLLGTRYTHDQLDYVFNRVSTSTATLPGIQPNFTSGTAGSAAPTVSKDDISYKAGFQYDIAEGAMAYATYTNGYKGPAFNIFFNMRAQDTQIIREEDVRAYEIGFKTITFNKRASLNLALFNEEYRGFHANSFIQVAGATVSTLTNAGNVITRGAEAEFNFRLMQDLTLTGGVAYTDAKIDKANCPTGSPASCQLRNGLDLAFAPDLRSVVGVDWRLPFSGDLPFNVLFNTSYSYQSDVNYDLDRNPLAAQDSYGLLDVGFALAAKDNRYRVSLLARNLTDENYISLKVPAAFVRNQLPRDAERYVSATVVYNFGEFE
jgi:iron complex outermembrane receptor protein